MRMLRLNTGLSKEANELRIVQLDLLWPTLGDVAKGRRQLAELELREADLIDGMIANRNVTGAADAMMTMRKMKEQKAEVTAEIERKLTLVNSLFHYIAMLLNETARQGETQLKPEHKINPEKVRLALVNGESLDLPHVETLELA